MLEYLIFLNGMARAYASLPMYVTYYNAEGTHTVPRCIFAWRFLTHAL
jgi:hypothetical protein